MITGGYLRSSYYTGFFPFLGCMMLLMMTKKEYNSNHTTLANTVFLTSFLR
jgi:hypothetical protein